MKEYAIEKRTKDYTGPAWGGWDTTAVLYTVSYSKVKTELEKLRDMCAKGGWGIDYRIVCREVTDWEPVQEQGEEQPDMFGCVNEALDGLKIRG